MANIMMLWLLLPLAFGEVCQELSSICEGSCLDSKYCCPYGTYICNSACCEVGYSCTEASCIRLDGTEGWTEPTLAKFYDFKSTDSCKSHEARLIEHVSKTELPDLLALAVDLDNWRSECVLETSQPTLKSFKNCNYEFLMMETDTRVMLMSLRDGKGDKFRESVVSVLKHLPYFHADCLPNL
mmetsp:Transcript_599/g.1004  ORF Transcript_599/g.1004 Transcript_599/m.1004 type:complete len:183 (-) Transcript_599:1091-1639(-)